jgi:hypothetical protein
MALFIGANLLIAMMLLAVAVSSFQTDAFPAWLSAVTAAGNIVPLLGIIVRTGPLAPNGWVTAYAPYPLFMAWLMSATIVMLRRIEGPKSFPLLRRSGRFPPRS